MINMYVNFQIEKMLMIFFKFEELNKLKDLFKNFVNSYFFK